MKLGLFLDYAQSKLRIPIERVQLAERLGFDSIWTAEAYGSDALTPLAFVAAHTRRIRLGTGIVQLAGRPPAMLAMQIATVDQLAGGGRVICGLGLSGPQIVEGWYGQPWGRPQARLRDYVAILRKILRREEPVEHHGKEIQLPYAGPGALGVGKPLKSILHMNSEIPIWLGTGGAANVRLTAEIADGWLPMGFVPGMMKIFGPSLDEGFARGNARRNRDEFEIQAQSHVIITDEVRTAIDSLKPMTALYVGGMGHQNTNFHKDQMVRRGYAEAAEQIQDLFLAGQRTEAIHAVPDEYIDEGALIGPRGRIRERFERWRDSGVTGLTLHVQDDAALELMADIAGLSPTSRR
ncbi:MAG: LLM class F420-dependent oxidoreductase [Candidatus Binatia bacterium]